METIVKYPKKAGVYKLTSKINGKIYIGKAINLQKRLSEHKNSENKEIVNNFIIQKAIKKYGWDSFDVEILELLEDFDKNRDNQKILNMESVYINLLDATNPEIGYNVSKFSRDRTGCSASEETRLKMSMASKGKPKSKEHIERMRISKTGLTRKAHSPEALEKMRQSKIGKKRPPFSEQWKRNIGKGHLGIAMPESTKQKIREANLGREMSDTHKEKLRIINTGKKISEETKEKIRQGNIGNQHTKETKEHLRNVNLGRKMSPEAKEKMSNVQKGNKNASGKRSEETKQKMRESRLAYLKKREELEQLIISRNKNEGT